MPPRNKKKLSSDFGSALAVVAIQNRLPCITERDVRLEALWRLVPLGERNAWLTAQMTSTASAIARPYSKPLALARQALQTIQSH